MEKNVYRFFLIVCMAIVIVISFTACGSKNQPANKNYSPNSGSPSTDKDEQWDPSKGPEANELPIADGNVTLTIYSILRPYAREVYESYADSPFTKYVMDQTGLNLKFIHVPDNDDGTFFNTVIASGEYPDLFYTKSFQTYPGGPEGAMNDGVLLNINDLIERYAPNFIKQIDVEGPEMWKRVKNDNGTIVGFGTRLVGPFLNGRINIGIQCRADWLRKVNMDPPETIEEYTEVLLAFKNELNVQIPLALPKATESFMDFNLFASAYGVPHDLLYLDEGTVKYSRIQPGYKKYLQLLNQYYTASLIDKDFGNKNQNDQKVAFQNGKAGMAILGNWVTKENLTMGAINDPDYDLIGLQYPVLNKGDKLHLASQITAGSLDAWYVSATSKHPVEAVRFVDYLCMDETIKVADMGLGVDDPWQEYQPEPTYDYDDQGNRIFTDFIVNNPKLDYGQALERHVVQPFKICWADDFQKNNYDAPHNIQVWEAYGTNNDQTALIPKFISLTTEESKEYTNIMNQITTFTDEMFYKYVFGLESFDTFDDFVERVKSFNIDRAVEIQQAAYDRYMSR